MVFRLLIVLGLITALSPALSPAHAKPFEVMFPKLMAEVTQEQFSLLNSMDYKTGIITVGGNLATFNLGDKFYFLDKKDANYVLTELWGNPPSEATMGMIFPRGLYPPFTIPGALKFPMMKSAMFLTKMQPAMIMTRS